MAQWFRQGLTVAGPFVCRCPISLPCSVSIPRSSNRTCGFAASGSPTGFARRHTDRLSPSFAARTVASEAAESLTEVVGNMATLQTLGPFHNAPEVRPLPSPGITRLRRYYEPVRLPRRPGLSLAGVRLTLAGHRLGSPVLRPVSLCRHAVATTPVGPPARISRSPESGDGGLPRVKDGSAPTLKFSRPARRSLALRPACSRNRLTILSIEGFGAVVTDRAASIATGWSDPLPGGNCTH